jgi:hypothetical protein
MLLEDDAITRRPLDYSRSLLAPLRLTYMVAVGAVVLVSGGVAAWCFVHTIQVIVETQRVIRSKPIDFDRSYLGTPVENSIPLGILSAGVGLVALLHFIRLWNGRKGARRAA